jgi:hypothetical protein
VQEECQPEGDQDPQWGRDPREHQGVDHGPAEDVVTEQLGIVGQAHPLCRPDQVVLGE